MEKTWEALVQRHSALRCSILWEDLDEPLQAIHRRVSVPWQHLDWRAMSVVEQAQSFEEWKNLDRRRGFVIDLPPLMRMTLIRLQEERYWLVWTSHHAVADGWSVSVLLEEMCELYSGLDGGELPALPPAFAYSSHIGWLGSRDMAAAKTYWRETLAGFTEPTELQTPRPTASSASIGHGSVRRHIDREASLALRDLARDCEVSLYTVMQAAWGVILHRYSGRDDVVFGVTVSGRPSQLPGIQSAVGMFVNTLPVRHGFYRETVLRDWLRELQSRSAGFMAHEFAPLPRVKEWSDVPGGTELFDSILVMTNYPTGSADVGVASSWSAVEVDVVHYSNFGLALDITPGEKTEVKLVYDARVYSEKTARQLLGDFTRVLQDFVTGLDQPVFSIGPPGAADTRLLIDEWGRGDALSSPPVDVLDLFRHQVAQKPDTIAVCCGTDQLSYAELDSAASRVAGLITQSGCEAGCRIAVYLERGVEFVTTVLAILKVGGVYVTVDPLSPPARIVHILDDSGCRLVIARDELATAVAELGPPVMRLDDPGSSVTAVTGHPAEDHAGLAYVIYTSGSTGEPKGVAVTRANLAFSNRARTDFYGDDPGCFLLLSTFSFDSSVAGLFWSLCTGGKLVISEYRLEQDMRALGATMASHGVTHTLCLPSLYRFMLKHLEPASMDALRVLILAGETLTPALVREHRKILPNTRLYNQYGLRSPPCGQPYSILHLGAALMPYQSASQYRVPDYTFLTLINAWPLWGWLGRSV